MIRYIMKHKCAVMCNIFKRLPFYDLKNILEDFKASHHPPIPTVTCGIIFTKKEKKAKEKVLCFAFPFFDLQFSSSYSYVFFLSVVFFYTFYFLFFRFLAFLCFILLYFLLTNDLRGAAAEPIIPNIPLTRSVNVGLIASRSHVS